MNKVTSCEVRASFLTVFVPKANKLAPDKPPKYSIQMLVPKNDEGKKFLKDLRDAYNEALVGKWPNGAPVDVREFMGAERNKPCVRDGDEKRSTTTGELVGGEYSGHWYINASNAKKPGVIHTARRNVQMTDDSEFQSGDYCYVKISVYAYAHAGNFGVGFGLENVMMTRKGDPLTGGEAAEEAFAGIAADTSEAVGFGDEDDPLA